ncbi:MAG: DUF4174 domain-containing protein [Pseudomonadota bacterium]
MSGCAVALLANWSAAVAQGVDNPIVRDPDGGRPRLLDTRDGAALDAFRWKYRLLIIWAEEPDAVRAQIDDLEDADLIERDLLIVRMFGRVHGFTVAPSGERPPWTRIVDLTDTPFEEGRGEGLRAPDYLAVLIGKDGDEKARWTAPVSASDLFGTIDAMPMRRREVRDEGGR